MTSTLAATAPAVDDRLADEAEELDGYFSDAPLDPHPRYPKLDESLTTAIILTNLPQVTESKLEKLIKVVTKTVSRIGALAITDDLPGVYMPFDDATQSTVGVCLVEYEKAEHAATAVEVLQGYKFDKSHTLTVTSLERARQLQQDPSLGGGSNEEFAPPPPAPFVEPPRAVAWMEDAHQRDSFVIRYGAETVVSWWDAKQAPVVDYDGSREKDAGQVWCEYYCHWSPQGSYLATLVPSRGVILWSGPKYEKVGRFVAPGVQRVLFSPQEQYLLTNNMDPRDTTAIKVYEIRSGKLLRAFPLFPNDKQPTGRSDGEGGPPPPPAFSWSHDDKYLARQGTDLISIFETPGMRLLDQRSFVTPGICDFQWSPSDNVLAYWAPEADNSPAHVDVIELPSRNKLRQKNLFNVTACQMVWHPQGDYLAVKVTRHTKSKKTFYNNIELFRLRSAGVPVEMLEIKDAVMALQWEPRGSRFAMIHAENPQATKVKVSFYDMLKAVEKTRQGKKNKTITYIEKVPELHLVETLEGKQCNVLFWSPAGTNIIMASLGDTASGTLEFYDVDSKTLVVKEHYRANQVLWDPAGRSVATIVSQPIEGGHFKFAMDNGYIIWSFQGKQLYQESFETFYMFAWRPRPILLSAQEIKKVERNLKKYEEQFVQADRERLRRTRLEETRGKRMERSRVREIIQRNRAIRQRFRAEHIDLLGGYDSEDDAHYEIREISIPTVLSTKEETVM